MRLAERWRSVELESIQDGGGVGHLQEVAGQIKELRRDCLEELDVIEAELAAEEKEDADLRAHYGPRWTRPASAQLVKTMRDKLAGYRGNLMQAGESDRKLETKLAAEAAAFAALDPEAAATQMPRMQAPMLSVDNMEPAAAVATLRQALEGLSTLSAQRAALEEALKDRKNKDNVLPRLLGGTDSPDELFQAELKKYDDLIMEVDNNVSKSAQLLDAVAASQATFRQAYGYAEWRRACESAAAGIKASARTYKELRDNLGEGLRFYMGLQEAIGTLRQQAGDHCMTRRIQRDDVIEDLRKQAAEEADRAAAQLAAMTMQQQQAQQAQQAQQQQAQQAPPPPPPGPAPSLSPASSGHYAPPPPPPPQQQQQQAPYGAPQGPPPQQAQQGGYQHPPQQYQPPQQQQYYQQQYPPPQYQQTHGYGAPPPPPTQQGYAPQQQPMYSYQPGGYPPQQPGPYGPPQQQQQWGGQPQYAQQPPAAPGQGAPQPPPTQPQQHSNPISQYFGQIFK